MTNSELAAKLRDLHAFLVIAGYDEMHARRYVAIARTIEHWPEPVETLREQGRLRDIPQVGPLVASYIKEIMIVGASSKQREWEKSAPWSVVELTHVQGIGPKLAQKLFHEAGIKSLAELKAAARDGRLEKISGIGTSVMRRLEG